MASMPRDVAHANLEHALQRAIGGGAVVGAMVMVLRHGEILFQQAAGFADREAGVKVAPDTLFRLASMTKLIVSVAALSLHDEGLLDLEAPVSRWLPWFRPCLADGSCPAISVRHLLTHTAGLTYGFEQGAHSSYARAGVSDGLDWTPGTLRENLARLARLPLQAAPGHAWQYSLATDVLGAVLEEAAGCALPELVAQRVTRPLGMRDTAFTVADPGRLAAPYMDGGSAPLRMPEPAAVALDTGTLRLSPGRACDPAAYASGGAGMIGSCADYVRLLEALRTGGEPCLRAATARRLVSNAIGPLPVPSRGPGWRFGLGPLVLSDPAAAGSRQGRGTWGWGGVYGCHYWVDPQAGLTLVALTNTAVAGLWGAFPDSLVAALTRDVS